MNQVKSIFKNTGWMTISQGITSICAFLWTILIARYLGVFDYGVVSFAISFTGLFGIVMDIGISVYTTRELSRDRSQVNKFVGNIVPLKSLLTISSFLVILFILLIIGYDALTIIVTLIFAIELVFMSFMNFFGGVFQAFEELKYQAIGTILNSILLLIGILLTMYFDLGVIFIAIAYTVAYVIFLAYLVVMYLFKFEIPKLSFNLSFLKETIINSLPFGLTNFFYSVYFSIDIVMLTSLVGNYPTGLYKSAYNIINVFATFFPIYTATIFPVMSKYFVQSKDMVRVSYETSVKYLLIIILPISAYVFLYATPLINLIYSNQYSLAGAPMQVLIWTVAFLFVNGAGSSVLNSVNKEMSVTKIYVVAAIVNVILNSILIPKYSFNGAAIATVLSEIVICVLVLYSISKTDFKPNLRLLKPVTKVIVSSGVMGVLLYFIGVNMWLAIPIGVVVYLVMLLITRTLDDTDKYIIKELLDKN